LQGDGISWISAFQTEGWVNLGLARNSRFMSLINGQVPQPQCHLEVDFMTVPQPQYRTGNAGTQQRQRSSWDQSTRKLDTVEATSRVALCSWYRSSVPLRNWLRWHRGGGTWVALRLWHSADNAQLFCWPTSPSLPTTSETWVSGPFVLTPQVSSLAPARIRRLGS
jgi:hypothetical protein